MSTYTTEIRHIVDSGVDLFDFDYELFDEKYKSVLEQKFIDHFYFREIGLETVGQFKHFLRSKFKRIIPYYNKLYETEGLITTENYDTNQETTETHTKSVDQASQSSTEGTSTSNTQSQSTTDQSDENEQVYSDTPQARLSGNDNYATNMTENTGSNNQTYDGTSQDDVTSNTSDNGTLTTTEEYETHLIGNNSMKYPAQVLQEWRKIMLNIDQMILDECEDLFMNIW